MLGEVQESKNQLEAALGDDVNIQNYWNDFKKALNGGLNKDEWDSKALGYLGELNVHLHNAFLTAVVRTADSLTPPSRVTIKGKHNAGSTFNSSEHKERINVRPKLTSAWHAPFDRDHAASVGSQCERTALTRRLHMLLSRNVRSGLPGLPDIFMRSYVAAMETGLKDTQSPAQSPEQTDPCANIPVAVAVQTDVDEKVAQMMLLATNHYIKDILEESIAAKGTLYTKSGAVRHAFGGCPTRRDVYHAIAPTTAAVKEAVGSVAVPTAARVVTTAARRRTVSTPASSPPMGREGPPPPAIRKGSGKGSAAGKAASGRSVRTMSGTAVSAIAVRPGTAGESGSGVALVGVRAGAHSSGGGKKITIMSRAGNGCTVYSGVSKTSMLTPDGGAVRNDGTATTPTAANSAGSTGNRVQLHHVALALQLNPSLLGAFPDARKVKLSFALSNI